MSRVVRLACLAFMMVTVLSSGTAMAQNVTTGTLTGLVADAQAGVLPGVTVVATHTSTGTQYETVSGADGRFVFVSVRIGPYDVSVSLAGFKTETMQNVAVALGETTDVPVTLQLAGLTETVTVEAVVDTVITGSRTGTTANVSQTQIRNLPTVARSLEDFARTSPYFSPTASNADPSAVSVAGRNNRYNNIQIDGAVNNDLFGLAATGTPGGQTESQPISIDSIEELQLLVAPYDVRQGGFSGGGLNAVTKSGTNQLHGTAYYFGRNESLVGDRAGRAFGTFSQKLGGASVGGPILRNRAFFFGNFEIDRKGLPSGFSIGGGEGQDFGRSNEATRILNVLKNRYGYDPGGTNQFTRAIDNGKFFLRADMNVSRAHKLTVRHNFIDATNDIGRLSFTEFFFPDYFYQIQNRTNSTVAQLNSTFGRAYNELRVNYTRVRDDRDGKTRFPSLEIQLGLGQGGGLFRAGRERSSTANELDQDIVEVTNDLIVQRGSHTYTFGTHNELFGFRNLFIQNTFGFYTFFTLESFEAGLAQGYQYAFSNTPDPLQAARFDVRQYGVYAGDLWRVSPRFTLNYGLRVDAPTFPDKPTRNPITEQAFGIRTDVTPKGLQWSPRLGFNYNLSGTDARQQVRGGIGIFNGRTPYVWLSNQYTGTGLEFTRITVLNNAANNVPFVADPDAQPRNLGTAAVNEVNLVDPDYAYPRLLRWNVAYDRTIFGLTTTAEFLHSKTLREIFYQNLNFQPTGQTRPDQRPIVGQVNRTFSNAIFLTNTDRGDQWTASLKVDKPFRENFFASGSYLYGRASAVNDGGSSTAFSNWRFLYVRGDPNRPELGISNFDVRHRINAMASYRLPLGPTGVLFSMFYNLQSGRPYSSTFSNDMNGDLQDNDIMYVPRDASEVIVTNGTWDELDAYIRADSAMKNHRGEIPERNTGRGPWTNTIDFRAAFDLPFRRQNSVQLTLDVQNFGNMLNSSWGIVQFPNFNEISPVRFDGIDAATGRMIYNLAPMKAATFRRLETDDPRSRWQAQVGLRYRF